MTLKICFLINGLGTGGAERSLVELLPYLVEVQIPSVIVCFYRRSEGVEQSVLDGGHDVRFLTDLNFVARVRALRRILIQEEPDLLHTTLFDADVVGRVAAAGLPVAVVSSLVNTPYNRVRLQDKNIWRWKLWLAKVIDGWTARHLTSHFHAITHAVKDAAVGTLNIPPEQITVVERGRAPERLGSPSTLRRQRARHRLGLGEHDAVIVNVARQEFQKGQAHLLQALAELLQRRPGVTLLIAGRTGNASPDLTRRSEELGLGERVRFLGHRSDVPEILAAADLFVFPSLYEGLGGALIEAMALGLPIVASDLPVTREVVEAERNALLVKPASPSALAAAIDALLDDSERARAYGRRSREIFEERFLLEKSASRMITLYRSVVRSSADESKAIPGVSKYIKSG